MSSTIDQIIPSKSCLERIAAGFGWAEGPIWIQEEKCLLFSDICNDTIYRWRPYFGLSVYRKPSGYANGNAIDCDGRLVTCEHKTRRITRTENNKQISTVVNRFENLRFNSPNDLVFRSDGSMYFTDPAYGLEEPMGGPGQRELPFQGVYRYTPKTRSVTLETNSLSSPNGLAFSPDESILYINDSDRNQIFTFFVQSTGELTEKCLFAQLDTQQGPGWTDGMKTDLEGNVFSTGPGGVWVFDSQGNILGIIEMQETATNLVWGGDSWRDLYITTATESFTTSCLYRIQQLNPGQGTG